MTRAKQQVLLFHTLLLARGPACSCHGSSIHNWETENELHVLGWSGSLLCYEWPETVALLWAGDGVLTPWWPSDHLSVWWLWLCSVAVLHQEIPNLLLTNKTGKVFLPRILFVCLLVCN